MLNTSEKCTKHYKQTYSTMIGKKKISFYNEAIQMYTKKIATLNNN